MRADYSKLSESSKAKEAELKKQLKDAKNLAKSGLKAREAKLEEDFQQERIDMMKHITILEAQIEEVERASHRAINDAVQQKVETAGIVAAKEVEVQSLKDLRKDMQTHVDDLELMIEHVTNKCMDITNAVAASEKNRVELQKDKEHHMRRIEDLEAKLSDTKVRAGHALTKVLDRARVQQVEYIRVKEELAEAKAALTAHEKASGEAASMHMENENKIAELSLVHQKMGDSANEIDKQKTQLRAANAEIKSLNLAVEKAKIEINAAKSAAEIATATADKLRAEIKELKRSGVNVRQGITSPKGNGGESPVLSDVEDDGELADFYNDLNLDLDIGELSLDKPLDDLV